MNCQFKINVNNPFLNHHPQNLFPGMSVNMLGEKWTSTNKFEIEAFIIYIVINMSGAQ